MTQIGVMKLCILVHGFVHAAVVFVIGGCQLSQLCHRQLCHASCFPRQRNYIFDAQLFNHQKKELLLLNVLRSRFIMMCRRNECEANFEVDED